MTGPPCVHLDEADQAAWDAGGHAMLPDVPLSGTRDQVRRRLDEHASRVAPRSCSSPCGPDTRGELERFLEAATSDPDG